MLLRLRLLLRLKLRLLRLLRLKLLLLLLRLLPLLLRLKRLLLRLMLLPPHLKLKALMMSQLKLLMLLLWKHQIQSLRGQQMKQIEGSIAVGQPCYRQIQSFNLILYKLCSTMYVTFATLL